MSVPSTGVHTLSSQFYSIQDPQLMMMLYEEETSNVWGHIWLHSTLLQVKASAFTLSSLHLQQEKSYLVYSLKIFVAFCIVLANAEGSVPPPTSKVRFTFS